MGLNLKKAAVCGCAALALLALAACAGRNGYQMSIYNDDAKIAKQGDSYTFANCVGDTDNTGASLEFSGFSGKQTLWEIETDSEGALTLDADVALKSGEFKLCLVDPDGAITVLSEGEAVGEIPVAVAEGVSHIVMVGSSAKGQLEVTILAHESLIVRAMEGME